MGEATIGPKALEDAILKALPSLFPNLLGMAGSPRVEFYDKFQREADEHDRYFTKKYDEGLTTTLIFAGLFSVITSAFILDVQRSLQPDFTQMSYDLLRIIAVGGAPAGSTVNLPQWGGPDPTVVHVQSILYASLALSLLAAFISILGKQWLNRYVQTETREPTIDRSRHRQRKMNGMVAWHFDLVMECPPLMLQVALLLLGCALSNYLFFLNKTVGGVVIGFTVLGLLFYLLIVSAATFSYNCPFQTPLSLILHSFTNKRKKYLKRTRKRFTSGNTSLNMRVALPVANTAKQLTPIFDEEIDLSGYVLDSKCIAWMFEMSTDADVVMAIMRFIPEVIWHAGIRSTPLERLYDTVLECFDRSTGRPMVIPKLRNKAYLGAKALLHLAIQRKCIGDDSHEELFNSISRRHVIMGSERYEGDSDLESTLGIIDRVFGNFGPIPWQNFSFTVPHHAWMGDILRYRALDVIGKSGRLPDDIRKFTLHSLRLDPPPPAPIVADCLYIVGLVLGIEWHIDDLLFTDKSRDANLQINRIFDKLTMTFESPTPTTDEIDCALEAMELIAPLSEESVARKSCDLFHVIMKSPASPAFAEEKKWGASRLAIHGAYKSNRFLPSVEDPQDILDFLNHNFDLVTRGDENQDEPIQDALRALAFASSSIAIKVLEYFDPTEPSFVQGICHVYKDDNPFELRKAALFFLPLIGDKWFNTLDPIMKPDQMRSFCVDWASAVDGIKHTHEVQRATLAVLFGMINSPHWRPHIVAEKWELLKYVTSVPDDSQPLRRCLDNPDLMDAIRDMGNTVAMARWLGVLWVKYAVLITQVREQLEIVTREVAQSERSADLVKYLSVVDSESRKAEHELTQHNAWSTAAKVLNEKIENLRQAKTALTTFIPKGEGAKGEGGEPRNVAGTMEIGLLRRKGDEKILPVPRVVLERDLSDPESEGEK